MAPAGVLSLIAESGVFFPRGNCCVLLGILGISLRTRGPHCHGTRLACLCARLPVPPDRSKANQRRDGTTVQEGAWTRERNYHREVLWAPSRARCVCAQELLILVSPLDAKIALVSFLVPRPPLLYSCFYFLFSGFAFFPRFGPSFGASETCMM